MSWAKKLHFSLVRKARVLMWRKKKKKKKKKEKNEKGV